MSVSCAISRITSTASWCGFSCDSNVVNILFGYILSFETLHKLVQITLESPYLWTNMHFACSFQLTIWSSKSDHTTPNMHRTLIVSRNAWHSDCIYVSGLQRKSFYFTYAIPCILEHIQNRIRVNQGWAALSACLVCFFGWPLIGHQISRPNSTV